MPPTRWDFLLFVRAAALAALALGLAWLVTAATDEGGIGWGERAGRTLPLAPACACVGTWVALAPVRARGEALALFALGRSRVQVAGAAVAGGAAAALIAALAIGAAPAIDVSAFFPRATRQSAWAWHTERFVDRALGFEVGADGVPLRLTPEPAGVVPTAPSHGRAAAAIATALAGLALPLVLAHALLSRPSDRASKAGERKLARADRLALLASGSAVVGSVVLFQSAAALRTPALLAAGPPTALLVFAVGRYWTSP